LNSPKGCGITVRYQSTFSATLPKLTCRKANRRKKRPQQRARAIQWRATNHPCNPLSSVSVIYESEMGGMNRSSKPYTSTDQCGVRSNTIKWCPSFEAWQYLSRVVPDFPARAVFYVLLLDVPEVKTSVFSRDHGEASVMGLIVSDRSILGRTRRQDVNDHPLLIAPAPYAGEFRRCTHACYVLNRRARTEWTFTRGSTTYAKMFDDSPSRRRSKESLESDQ
jgi:hypothetical protein